MSEYRAPTREILFTLNELADAASLAEIPDFEEATPDVVEAILEEAGKLAGEVLAPLNWSGDQQGSKYDNGEVISPDGFKEAYQQFIDNGWLSLAQDPDFGGQGLPFALHAAVTEMWNSSNISFALNPMLTAGAIEAIIAHASDELKDAYLHNLVSGEWTGTMNLTEPQAGSDLSAVQSKAVSEGDHYLISGQKIFISWGEHQLTDNIVHLVLARLPDSPPGVKGISLFLVPKFLVKADGSLGERNDVECVSIEHKLGIHASPTCVMSFGGVSGAIGYLVGEANKGLACMFTMMNHARLEVGLEGIGLSERAYQHAVEYARERVQGTSPGSEGKVPIVHHGDVRRMLMVMRAQTQAIRAVAYYTAVNYDYAHHSPGDDKGKIKTRVDLLTPIVKGWSTEVAQEVTSLGVQVYGGMGYVEETGAAQYMRDARITTIYEGTTGIQANDFVGRKIIRDGGEALTSLFAEIDAMSKELRTSSDPQLKGIGEAIGKAFDQAHQALVGLLANAGQPGYVNGLAFNTLMGMGTLLGGWQLGRAALIAKAKLSAGDSDQDFYQDKITTACFYCEQVLPRAQSYFDAVNSGTESLLGIEAERL